MQGAGHSSSLLNGEAARTDSPGFLSVLLFPPLSALLFGTLLFLGLSRIPLIEVKASADAAPAPASNSAQIAPLFTAEIQRWAPQILAWASEHALDPNLIATVMQIESCGDPNALSSAGAIGLFQVMPYHFEEDEDPYSPATNAQRGLNYLNRALLAFEGNAAMAMAGYNGGINGASQPQSAWPQETIGYLYWGSNIYKDAISGKPSSAVLDEWLSAGGASLCQQAKHQLAALP